MTRLGVASIDGGDHLRVMSRRAHRRSSYLDVTHPPVINRDVAVLVEKNVPVYYLAEDRGIFDNRLVDGVKSRSRSDSPRFEEFDQVWHW